MPAVTRPLAIRPATLAAQDHELLIDLKDSHLAWLSSVGSMEQWGAKPSREANPFISVKTHAWVALSERQAPWGGDWCRVFIAETSSSSSSAVAAADTTPVAGLVLEFKAAAYTRPVIAEQDDDDPFVWLSYLITNRHAGEERKGAGAALIALAIEQTRGVGLRRICLDCYAGNDRKLVKYYESQRFVQLGDFTAVRDEYDSKGERMNWPGCVMEMRL